MAVVDNLIGLNPVYGSIVWGVLRHCLSSPHGPNIGRSPTFAQNYALISRFELEKDGDDIVSADLRWVLNFALVCYCWGSFSSKPFFLDGKDLLSDVEIRLVRV